MSQEFKKSNSLACYSQVSASSTRPETIAVFCARMYARFIEVKSNLMRKKIQITNQVSIETIQEHQFNLEEKDNPRILKDEFSSIVYPCIFTYFATKTV